MDLPQANILLPSSAQLPAPAGLSLALFLIFPTTYPLQPPTTYPLQPPTTYPLQPPGKVVI